MLEGVREQQEVGEGGALDVSVFLSQPQGRVQVPSAEGAKASDTSETSRSYM